MCDLSRIFSEYGKTKDYDKVFKAIKKPCTPQNAKRRLNDVKSLQDKLNLLSDKGKRGEEVGP